MLGDGPCTCRNQKALDLGSCSAMANLASAYQHGMMGMPRDLKKVRLCLLGFLADLVSFGQSTALLEDAAKKHDQMALFNLAMNYAEGIGVPRDPQKAFELYKQCSEAEDACFC